MLLAGVLMPSGGNRRTAIADEVARPNVTPAKPNRAVQLRDRLITGLKARLKSEVAFVDRVVALVQTRRLPQRLVDQTYLWARKRAGATRDGRTRRPILYFQGALTLRARRIGVAL
jgi:hypothetical protein